MGAKQSHVNDKSFYEAGIEFPDLFVNPCILFNDLKSTNCHRYISADSHNNSSSGALSNADHYLDFCSSPQHKNGNRYNCSM